jgi:hypothetical protein
MGRAVTPPESFGDGQCPVGVRAVFFVPLGTVEAAQAYAGVDLLARGAYCGEQRTQCQIGFTVAAVCQDPRDTLDLLPVSGKQQAKPFAVALEPCIEQVMDRIQRLDVGLARLNGARRSRNVPPGHGKKAAAIVDLEEMLVHTVAWKRRLQKDFHARARGGDFGVALEPGDEVPGPWHNHPRLRITTVVQIHSRIGICGCHCVFFLVGFAKHEANAAATIGIAWALLPQG